MLCPISAIGREWLSIYQINSLNCGRSGMACVLRNQSTEQDFSHSVPVPPENPVRTFSNAPRRSDDGVGVVIACRACVDSNSSDTIGGLHGKREHTSCPGL